MALGAFEADAHESGRGALPPLLDGHGLLSAPIKVKAGALGVSGVVTFLGRCIEGLGLVIPLVNGFAVAAGGAQDPLDDLVVRHVFSNTFAEPVVPHLAADGFELLRQLQRVGGVAGDVGEPGGPQGGVERMGQQVIDFFAALVWIFVRQEGANLVRSRQATDGVDGQAAEEFLISRLIAGHHVEKAQAGGR